MEEIDRRYHAAREAWQECCDLTPPFLVGNRRVRLVGGG
jgi:hypothetical protein